MTLEENLYKSIRSRSSFILNNGNEWKKELSSAKNFIATPDLKDWTFGKSANLDNKYHENGGVAKRWLYSLGFVNVLALPENPIKQKAISSFLNWAKKVDAFDIGKKFHKDQENKKRFEILIHASLIPKKLLIETNISIDNQTYFDEGFKSQIVREVAKRNKQVVELAKLKFGTKCSVCKFDFGKFYGTHGEMFIEMHHLYPIYLGKRKTTVEDLQPVCSNCHRMLHKGERMLSLEELKEIVKQNRAST